MTLLSVIKDVCATVGVAIPQSVFSNLTGNRTMQEMLSFANEMAQRIAYDNREWTRFKVTCTYAGDDITTAFDLPANYKRMLLTSNVWRSTSTQRPMLFVPDTDTWLTRRVSGEINGWGEWTMIGGQMHIFPVMAVGEVAYFVYLDKNCIALKSGGFGDAFTADDDSFALDERLLKLGMIWQWKANKGASYAEDLGTYNDAMDYARGHDGPSPIIVGRQPVGGGWNASYL